MLILGVVRGAHQGAGEAWSANTRCESCEGLLVHMTCVFQGLACAGVQLCAGHSAEGGDVAAVGGSDSAAALVSVHA